MGVLRIPLTDAKACLGMLSERLSAGLLCCMIAGCGTLHPEDLPWNAGWRRAQIIEIDRKPDFSQQPEIDCRNYFAEPENNALHFALVKHRFTRHQGQLIVSLDPRDSFREGEYVYVNLNDCSKPAQRGKTP